jgi:Ca2+-binding RTX toxin-like protein
VYPHVTQFTTRRRQIAGHPRLFRGRTQVRTSSQPPATTEAARGVRGRVALALRLLCLLSALTLAGLMVPPSAFADGDLTRVGGQLRYDSDGGTVENLTVTLRNSTFQCGAASLPCIQFANSLDVRDAVPGSDCVEVVKIVVACSTTGVTSILLKLDDGDDTARVFDSLPTATMDGGVGSDTLESANGADTLLGGLGNDKLFDIADTLGGDDLIDGGGDNDMIGLGAGDDNVIGGIGVDTVTLDSGDDTLRLDDIANDGPPGEAKNIHSDVEVIDGDGGSDKLFGNGAANTLAGGSGNDVIDGGEGADVLEGGAGSDELNGGPDFDLVRYSDSGSQTITLDEVRNDGVAGELDNAHSDIEDVDAGPGNDTVTGNDSVNTLDGGEGDDRLEGRGGVDTFFGGNGADALFVRDGLRERVECGPGGDGGEGDTIDLVADCEGVALSAALVPDADGDGSTKPADCNDENPAIHPGAVDIAENGVDENCDGADAVVLDRDRDGFPRPLDCNDNDPRVHPGATDVPGNRVDEDCRGGATPFPVLPSAVTVIFRLFATHTTFDQVIVRRAQAGSTVQMSCTGPGCKFGDKRARVTRNRNKLVLPNPLRGAKLRAGTRFEVRVTKPRTVGLVVRYSVRSGRAPARTDLCLQPGAKRPGRCPL